MKSTIIILSLVFLSNTLNASAPEPEEEDNGVYVQALSKDLSYKADTVSQLCFAVGSKFNKGFGFTAIPCQSLYLRNEWKPFLTWLNK